MALLASFSFLVDDCHPVEVVLGEVEVLTGFVYHVLALVVVEGQLLNFETVLVVDLVSHAARVRQLPLSLSAGLAMVVAREGYLRVALIRRNLLGVHVQRVHILRVLVHELLLALPGVDDARTLHISFLSSARSPTRHPLSVASYTFAAFALPVIASARQVWVEVVACPRQRGQHARLVDTWEHGANLPCGSLSLRVLILLALLLLLDVRAVTAVALRALIDVGLGCGCKCVLRPVLLLTRKDALVEELGVLPSVECVVADVLAVARSLSLARCSRLTVL